MHPPAVAEFHQLQPYSRDRRKRLSPPRNHISGKSTLELNDYPATGGCTQGGPPILPYPEVEGETAHALSSLAQFISLLHDLYTEIKEPHNIQQWEKILQHILDNFLAQENESMESEDFSVQVLNLREQIISLTSRAAKTAEFKGAISLPGLIHILKQHLSPKNIEYGDSGGSIIFCSMLAMRSIPKKVICMLGLNDSAFPREDKRPNFDLIFACPQKETAPSAMMTAIYF